MALISLAYLQQQQQQQQQQQHGRKSRLRCPPVPSVIISVS